MAGNGYNLDLHNPNRPNDLSHRPPKELLAELIFTERDILALLEKLDREME
jgi:type I restriction enzyme M protein